MPLGSAQHVLSSLQMLCILERDAYAQSAAEVSSTSVKSLAVSVEVARVQLSLQPR